METGTSISIEVEDAAVGYGLIARGSAIETGGLVEGCGDDRGYGEKKEQEGEGVRRTEKDNEKVTPGLKETETDTENKSRFGVREIVTAPTYVQIPEEQLGGSPPRAGGTGSGQLRE